MQNIVLDLQAKLVRKDAQIDHLSQQYQHILEQFRLAQQRQFGQSTQASLNQLGLFNETEQTIEEDEPEAEGVVASTTRLRRFRFNFKYFPSMTGRHRSTSLM